jgi:hypothetical protein
VICAVALEFYVAFLFDCDRLAVVELSVKPGAWIWQEAEGPPPACPVALVQRM